MIEEKINMTFRLSASVLDLIRRTAAEMGLSGADVVESCVLRQVDSLLEKHRERAGFMGTKAAAEELGKTVEKRAKKPYPKRRAAPGARMKGTKSKASTAPAEGVLTESQQN